MALTGAILAKHSAERLINLLKTAPQKFQKEIKKVLTNGERCAKITKLSPIRRGADVP